MSIKKFVVGLAAGLVAVACATPVALAADPVTDAEAAVKSAQLDVDYFCNEESVYYDMAKCTDAEATLADANAKLEAAKAAASANVPSPVPDQTRTDLENAKLDAQYFCAEGTAYYDFYKCADLTARIKDLEKRDAELDVTWFCTYGTEYYDMVKCADAQARLGAGSGTNTETPAVNTETPAVNTETPAVNTETPSTTPDNSQSDAKEPSADAKTPKAEEAKGGLAKTGASFAPLMGIAAVVALAGGVMVARKHV